MLPSYILLDVETAPREEMAAYVTPDPRLKDPAKVAASIAERTADLGLDINGARIVVLGYWESTRDAPIAFVCRTEEEERAALMAFWEARKRLGYGTQIVGYNARRFDAPMVSRRSLLLNLPSHPRLSLKRYHGGDVYDLFEELTFFGEQGVAVVPRTLDNFCRLLKLDVPCDEHEISGEAVALAIAADDYEAVLRHNLADLHRTKALAERMGVIGTPTPVRKLTGMKD